MSSISPHVVVVGSINMDMVARVDHVPRSGETLLARDFSNFPGGKGANQAVGVARLGGLATLIARVGDDAFSYSLVDALSVAGVDTSAVLSTPNCPSGMAFITVAERGENCITVVSGANAELTPQDVQDQETLIATADVLLMQLELSLETVSAAAKVANNHGVFTILDPAPAPIESLPPELLGVDVLTPNQSEAERLTGKKISDLDSAADAAEALRRQCARRVAITLGADGAMACDKKGCVHVPAPKVTVADTTAAGDAFAAALAVRMASGEPFLDAVRFACAAGALAATKDGAHQSMHTFSQVQSLLKHPVATASVS